MLGIIIEFSAAQNTTAGSTYCSALSLQCLNGGTINPAVSTNCNLPLNEYTQCSTSWYLPFNDYCICPSGYTGIDCSLQTYQSCTNNTIWSGNVVDYGSTLNKSLVCAITSDAGPAYALKNHWLKLVVNDDTHTVTVNAYSQISSLTKADACTTTVDGFSCDLSDCAIGPLSTTNSSIVYQCNTIHCTGCNLTDCTEFRFIANAFTTSTQPVVIEFDTINTTSGYSSGSLIGRSSAISVNLPLQCNTGQCITNTSSKTTAGTYVNLYQPIANDVTGTIIVQSVISGVLFISFLLIGTIIYYNRYTKYYQPFRAHRNKQDNAIDTPQQYQNYANVSVIPLPGRLDNKLSDSTNSPSSSTIVFDAEPGKFKQTDQFNNNSPSNSKNEVNESTILSLPQHNKFSLNISNIYYSIHSRTILNNITCQFQSSELIALIGQSGSGKTTMLNLISGNLHSESGSIYISDTNNNIIDQAINIGYVAQNDTLLHTQTVREHLLFYCKLKTTLLPHEVDDRVDTIMSQLHISHISDLVIGVAGAGISGGERRRLSIGISLISQPSILLLDEPLSGLDSTNALLILQLIQTLSHQYGITCILSIHQSSARLLSMFDKVLALSRLGEIAYYGTPDNVESYFRSADYHIPHHMSISEYLLELTSHNDDKVIHDIHSLYQSKQTNVSNMTQTNSIRLIQSKPIQPYHIQLYTLLRRSIRHHSRSLTLYLIFHLVTLVVSVFIGYLFYHVNNDISGIQNRSGYFFFVLIYFTLTALTAIPGIIHEREQLAIELHNRLYTHSVYLIQYCAVDWTILRILPSIINTIICYYLIELNQHNASYYLQLLAVVSLVGMTSSMLCISISTIASNIETANFISICLIMYCLLFGGLLVNATSGWLHGLSYLSYLHYAYEIMFINEFHDLNFSVSGNGLPSVTVTGNTFVDTFGFNSRVIPIDFGVIVCFCSALYIIAYIALRIRIKV